MCLHVNDFATILYDYVQILIILNICLFSFSPFLVVLSYFHIFLPFCFSLYVSVVS